MNCKWYNATAWYATYLTKILNQNGHESLLITIPNSIVNRYAEKLGVAYQEMPFNSHSLFDLFSCYKKIKQICSEFRPDIVNCHRSEGFLLWANLKKQFHYKLVRTRGDQRLPKNNFFNTYSYNTLSDALIVTNSKMRQYFQKEMHIPSSKVYTILGGVDTNTFFPKKENRQEVRKKFGFTENDIVLGIIGRLDPIKGQFETLHAFKKSLLLEKDTTFHLAVLGQGCHFSMQVLEDLAKQLEIPKEQIHFYHYFEDINQFMNILDAGVISSLGSEAIARVAFEMIACDIPIIGSNVGVMPDILEKDFMFSPANIDEMANLFLKVKDEDFRNRIRESTQLRFKGSHDNYSIYGWSMNDFYQKTMTVYETI